MSASEQIEVFAALSGLSLEEALRIAKLIGTAYEPVHSLSPRATQRINLEVAVRQPWSLGNVRSN